MKPPRKTKNRLSHTEISKTGIINLGNNLSESTLSTWCQTHGMHSAFQIHTHQNNQTPSSDHPNVTHLNDLREISSIESLPDVFIVGKDLDESRLKAMLAALRLRSRPRKNTIYLGATTYDKVEANRVSRWTQKILNDLDTHVAASNIFVCGKETLLTLAAQLPNDFSGDNNAFKYIAERTEIKTRRINISSDTLKFPGKIHSLIGDRIKLAYIWYLREPMRRFIHEQWWNKSSAWSWQNMPLWRMLFAILAICFFVGMPILSFDYGVTWDEQIENDYGKDALNYLLTGGKDERCFDESIHLYSPMRNYGMIFNVPAAAIYRFISPFGEFETKHVLNALTGCLAMLFIGLIGKNIGGWRMGFIAMLFLLLSPRFFGHAMTNPKDIPFAAGYIMGVWAIIKLFQELPNPRKRTIFWNILALGFVMGVRIGGLMVVCYLAMMMGFHWLGRLKKTGFQKSLHLIPRYAAYLAVMAIGGFLIAIMTWPYALEDPINHPLEALSAITNVQYIVSYELFGGERTNMAALPWSYIPEWMAISTPLFILGGIVLSPLSRWPVQRPYKYKVILFCLFVLIFPLGYVVYQGSVLYNGWRHFLFFAPILALIGALGWDVLFRFKMNKIWIKSAFIVLLLLVLKTTWWMAKNHPFQYVYFNEIVGGPNGAYGLYETDYYGLSMRKGIEWLVKNEGIDDGRKVRVGVNCEIQTANYWAKKYSDNITIVWNRHYEKHKNQWDYALFASRTLSRNEIINGSYPPKGTIHTVDVDKVPILAIIKHDNTFLHDGYKALYDNRRDEAVRLFQQASNYDPSSEEAARMVGLAYYTGSQNELALQAFDRALEIWPESYLALFYKSQILLQKGDYANCYTSALEAIKHKSNVQGAHLNAGRAAMQLGLFEESRGHLEEAYKYSGGNANNQSDIYMLLGQSFLMESDSNTNPDQRSFLLQNSVNQLGRAIEINAENRSALSLIVAAFEQLGDQANADRYRLLLGGN